MTQQILQICHILKKHQYSSTSFKNNSFEIILFYKNQTYEKIIYGIIFNNNIIDKYVYIGNIYLDFTQTPVLGCNIAIKKENFTENKFLECIEYVCKEVEKEYKINILDNQMIYKQKFINPQEIIELYFNNQD